MVPKKPRDPRKESMLPFDVTQDIDPALAEEVRGNFEATLTQTDFDDITVTVPDKRKP